ncbi:MAG TPA: hypothetical protein VLJ14_14860 [Ktedonobacterales bacterium]|nr:hypothetical protein [Ktedonobacterales bacterium]
MSEKTTKGATQRTPRAAPRTARTSGKATKGAAASATQPASATPEAPLSLDEERQRQAVRENAKRVIRESGIGEMLRTLNHNALQERGWFEEYDSGVIMKWGTGYTRRHIWVDITGDALRFRLLPHIKCAAPMPACDGEYHSFTRETWRLPGALLRELHRNYEHPVAETSED